jgi:hypothetical protein
MTGSTHFAVQTAPRDTPQVERSEKFVRREDKCTLHDAADVRDRDKCLLRNAVDGLRRDERSLRDATDVRHRDKCALRDAADVHHRDKCALRDAADVRHRDKCALRDAADVRHRDKCGRRPRQRAPRGSADTFRRATCARRVAKPVVARRRRPSCSRASSFSRIAPTLRDALRDHLVSRRYSGDAWKHRRERRPVSRMRQRVPGLRQTEGMAHGSRPRTVLAMPLSSGPVRAGRGAWTKRARRPCVSWRWQRSSSRAAGASNGRRRLSLSRGLAALAPQLPCDPRGLPFLGFAFPEGRPPAREPRSATTFACARVSFAGQPAPERSARDAFLRSRESEGEEPASERQEPAPFAQERVPDAKEAGPFVRARVPFAGASAPERAARDGFLHSRESEAGEPENERQEPAPFVQERVLDAKEAAPFGRARAPSAGASAPERAARDSLLRSRQSEAEGSESEPRESAPVARSSRSLAREPTALRARRERHPRLRHDLSCPPLRPPRQAEGNQGARHVEP